MDGEAGRDYQIGLYWKKSHGEAGRDYQQLGLYREKNLSPYIYILLLLLPLIFFTMFLCLHISQVKRNVFFHHNIFLKCC